MSGLVARFLLVVAFLTLYVSALAQDNIQLVSLWVDQRTLASGKSAKAVVTIDHAVETYTRVLLYTSEDIVEIPASVKIPPGETTTTFRVRAKPVTSRTWTTLSVGYKGTFVRYRVYVEPPTSPTLTLDHSWCVGGGITWGTLNLYKIVKASSLTINLTSSDPAVEVPASITIPQYASSARFEVKTTAVTSSRYVTISGSALDSPIYARIHVRTPIVSNVWQLVGTNPNMLNNGGKVPADILPDAYDTITTRMQHAAAVKGRKSVTMVRLVYANYDTREYSGERPGDNPIYVKAAIEPMSLNGPNAQDVTPIPVLFRGQPWVEIRPGSYAVSDPVSVSLVDGARFYTRTTQRVDVPTETMCGGLTTLGSLSIGGFDTGEGMISGDYAYGGYIVPNAKYSGYSPSAILGYATNSMKTLAVCGDSIMAGSGDGGYRFASGGFGERAATLQFKHYEDRTINPLAGYVHLARGAERAKDFLSSTIRFELSCLASTAVINYINNDIGAWHETRYTERDIKDNLVGLVRRWLARGKQVVVSTCNPKTFTTDGYFTAENQNPRDTEALRVSLNEWIRDPAGLKAEAGASTGQYFVWDICAPIEVNENNVLTRNGGRWRAEPEVVDTGAVTTLAYLSAPSFKDKTKAWPTNSLSGYTVTFTTGINTGKTRVISHNDDKGHIVTRGGYSNLPSLNDQFVITRGIFTNDGTHPSSEGHAAIARGFPFAEVFGY